jgi:hypothetical protein
MSKKMLALNFALLAVLLVSLPLQLKAITYDFWDALNDWSDCNAAWPPCAVNCNGSLPCLFACSETATSCALGVGWPEPQMDVCTNAQARHNECVTERSVCESTDIEDCVTPYWECRTSSGIDQCQ